MKFEADYKLSGGPAIALSRDGIAVSRQTLSLLSFYIFI